MLSLYDHPVEDEIREVVDYDFLRLQIEKLAKVQKFALQEHFCDRVAALCLAFSPVMAVAVESCTPNIYPDAAVGCSIVRLRGRSEEHTSELQSLMRISYAVFCLQKKQY